MTKQERASESAFAELVRKALPVGSQQTILGRDVLIIRVGYYAGAYFEAGVVAGYWDASGIWLRLHITPAEVGGFFPWILAR